MDDNKNKLIASVFRRSMFPMIMTRTIIFLGPLLNGIIISRFLGSDSIAAYGLYIPFMFFILIIAQLFSDGIQNSCAISLGEGNVKKARKFYSSSIATVILVMVAVTAALWIFLEPIAEFLSSSKESASNFLPILEDYLKGLSFGLIFYCMIPVQIEIKFLEGNKKAVVHSVILQTIFNVVGGLLNVFYFHGGMFGMGLAESISFCISILSVIFIFKSENAIFDFKFSEVDFKVVPQVLKIGLPTAADRFYKSVQIFTVNKTLIALSPVAVAAYAGVNTMNNLFNPITIGMTACTFTLAGIFRGERDKDSLERLMSFSLKEIFKIELGVAIFAIVTAPFLVSLLVSDNNPEVFDATVTAFRIFMLYLPVYAINHVLQKYFHGINEFKLVYATSAMDNLIYICLCTILLGHFFGVIGVWSAFLISEILTFVSIMAIIYFVKRKSPFKVESYLMLPKDFDVDEKDRFENSAVSMDEIISISEAVRKFCIERGENKRNAMLIALTIEEMGRNILQWSNFNEKKNSIDIKVFFKGEWFIRIRDNTPPFNPSDWLKVHEENNATENIGIRMISKIAKELKYVSAMGMNNLTIKI